ncbi:MAG: phosphotransferase [Ignavibacteriae bacterium]|nr:fructosamine kinase [Ignavibacteriota bacterium]NOG96828.1 phosphotransferase [Ignavibacteriota bacterium]
MSSIQNKVEQALSKKITGLNSIGGGCIGNSKLLTVQTGEKYFVKEYSNSSIHFTEANGLRELDKASAIRVPKVIFVSGDFLLLEYINSSSKTNNFSELFGRQFARLHKHHSSEYGFYENNFIGSTDQINLPQKKSWVEFYFENRILYQFKLAEKNGHSTGELRNGIQKIELSINDILAGSDEQPSLLHGDLWSGNYMPDENGNPCLIDPAVYYGHREADLAMTKLFGGFDSNFYAAYNEEYPLKEGWQYRENIYKLYHVLNHLNLFGSGYYSQAISLISFYK